MKIISNNSKYQIFPDDIKTHDLLPNGTFKVEFSEMSGFSLRLTHDFVHGEEKVYGDHEKKVNKILNNFKVFNRSLGVILSGDKGIGKSLFIRLLAEAAIKREIPVIIVDGAYPGIENFIDSIEQEVLVLFDEFEKVFRPHDSYNPQDHLLGLFDGVSQHKRIYAITVNKLNQVNEYMVNRPGRFHYHLRFEYPTQDEVRTYLYDNTSDVPSSEIEKAISFASRVKLNFDCLRAIAFELDSGESFSDAINDLNIVNVEHPTYSFEITMNDGSTDTIMSSCDLFSNNELNLYSHRSGKYDYLVFNPSVIVQRNGVMYLEAGKFKLIKGDDDGDYDDVNIAKEVHIYPSKTETFHYGAL